MADVGVLVPHRAGTPEPPERRPIGRAALRLASEGISVLFGHRVEAGELIGHVAVPGGWRDGRMQVDVAYDRYPSQSDPGGHAALRTGLGDTPIANPYGLTLLCRDKIDTQRVLERAALPVAEITTDPANFQRALNAWGTAYLKPRFGAFGRGIQRVTTGDSTPATGPGAVPGQLEPLFLQRAIPPLAPWRGVACRVLCQRTSADTWWVGPPVARRSANDWVVNAARRAEVVPASQMLPDQLDALVELSRRTAAAMAAQREGAWLVELGVDLVINDRGEPIVIEVNSRPRGRLEALATQDPQAWMEAHVRACCRPLRYLAGVLPPVRCRT
jgi:glutathione synthase/RimK-type ligase-like ATP-grasp enzyme